MIVEIFGDELAGMFDDDRHPLVRLRPSGQTSTRDILARFDACTRFAGCSEHRVDKGRILVCDRKGRQMFGDRKVQRGNAVQDFLVRFALVDLERFGFFLGSEETSEERERVVFGFGTGHKI